jgi:hypothetical protein
MFICYILATMKSRIAILLITVLYILIYFNRVDDWRQNTVAFQWDKSQYYIFLPAIFIHHDLDNLLFYRPLNEKYRFTSGFNEVLPGKLQPNGHILIKYTIGTALLELPFFLLAHSYTYFNNDDPGDGYSYPYQQALAFCTIFWVVIGLILLSKSLKQFYSDTVTVAVLVCVGIGTNLYSYTAFDHGMSHPFSFFILCGVLWSTVFWHKYKQNKHLYYLSFFLVLTVLARPVDALVIFIPLLWDVDSLAAFKSKFELLWQRRKALLISLIVPCILLTVQFLYWKHATGKWFIDSYEDEGFRFPYSRLWKGLFSYHKGWFVYTPIALLGMLGIFACDKKHRLSLIFFFTSVLYLTFAWKAWWYGGSFGCRALVDILGIVAFPMAALLHKVYQSRWLVSKVSVSVFAVLCIALNMFQTFQFSKGIIHYDSMTKEYYWAVFGKTKLDKDYSHLLLSGEYLNKEKE